MKDHLDAVCEGSYFLCPFLASLQLVFLATEESVTEIKCVMMSDLLMLCD